MTRLRRRAGAARGESARSCPAVAADSRTRREMARGAPVSLDGEIAPFS